MSTKEAVTIVSRALAVYMLFWFLSDLTYLPSHIFSVWHHENGLGTTYWRDSERISLTFLLLRMVALFFAVQWFTVRVQPFKGISWLRRTKKWRRNKWEISELILLAL
jgi:hypothetical protein